MGDKIICDFITKNIDNTYLRTQWIKPWNQPKKKVESNFGHVSVIVANAIRKDGYYDMLYNPDESYFHDETVVNRTKHYFHGKLKQR